MKPREKQGLVFYQSKKLLKVSVDNYFFNRRGGYSRGAFESLNLSYRVGDDPEVVERNYSKVERVLGIKHLATVHQVHGKVVLDLDSYKLEESRLRKIEADAIITMQKGVAIAVLVADCFPLILADPGKNILAIAHCGRRPIILGVIENAISEIIARGGTAGDVIAAIGPGVGPECYTVDEKIIAEFADRFPKGAGKIWRRKAGQYHLDLKAAMVSILEASGVKRSNIDDLGVCTSCNDEFFSHRRSAGKTGRQIAVAMLE
jgi:hypothetical protein